MICGIFLVIFITNIVLKEIMVKSSFIISPKLSTCCNTVSLYFCIWLLRSNTVFPTYRPQGMKYAEEPWPGFVSRALIGPFFTFYVTLETARHNHRMATRNFCHGDCFEI